MPERLKADRVINSSARSATITHLALYLTIRLSSEND